MLSSTNGVCANGKNTATQLAAIHSVVNIQFYLVLDTTGTPT